MSLAMPIVQREPLPRGKQAELDEITHILRVAPGLPEHVYVVIFVEAILALNGRADLCEYARRPKHAPPPRRLRAVPDLPEQRRYGS